MKEARKERERAKEPKSEVKGVSWQPFDVMMFE